MKKSLLFLLMFFVRQSLFAQNGVAMADEMRSNGKIYVVVAVLLLIFLGIIIYLVRLDRKLTRLEKNTNS